MAASHVQCNGSEQHVDPSWLEIPEDTRSGRAEQELLTILFPGLTYESRKARNDCGRVWRASFPLPALSYAHLAVVWLAPSSCGLLRPAPI